MDTDSHHSLETANPSAHGFPNEIFCSSCRLKFEDLTSYKLHLTTEFHVYNARRRTADLAPISQQLFEQKRKDLLSCMSSEQSEGVHYCKVCRKQYQSQEMMDQHLRSNKHKKAAKKKGRKNSFSTDDGASSQNKVSEQHSDSNNPFDENFVENPASEDSKFEEPRQTTMDSLRICLFCNHSSEGVKKNLDHMRVQHSFYILDIDCLISLKALLHYLAEKVHVGYCCINCNKSFNSTLAVQNHMKDMCHCCMNSEQFDGEYEYFYDFAPTYQEDFKGKKLDDFDLTEEPLAKPLSEHIFSKVEQAKEGEGDAQEQEIMHADPPMEDIAEEDGDDDWEDVDVEDADEEEVKASVTESFQKVSAPSTESFTMIDKSQTPESKAHEEEIKSLAEKSNLSEVEVAKLMERRKKNRFDYQKVEDNYKKAIVYDTGEVQLPNGKIIGHRQWAREYKQTLPMRDEKEKQVMKKLGIEYNKLGNVGTIQKSFNPQYVIKKFNKAKVIHIDNKKALKQGMKNNKLNTEYFRPQIL